MNVLVLTELDLTTQASRKDVANIGLSDFTFSIRQEILRADLVVYEFEKNKGINLKCRWA